jgi:hypothetical protein
VDLLGGQIELGDQAAAPVLGMHDHRVQALVEAPLRRAL